MNNNNDSKMWTRRDLLQKLGIGISGYLVTSGLSGCEKKTYHFEPVYNKDLFKLVRPVTAITLGAGGRGNVYGNFARRFPDLLQIVGVAEPITIRRERYVDWHSIEADNSFNTWEDVFDKPKFADAIIITTPDDLHYGPCMAALKLGYDILLEKPIAPTESECKDILKMSQQTGRIVAVCHVLRYAPYFMKIKSLLSSGAIGQIISMQHFEPIEHTHMAHSYVRGNWHNSKKSTPIILAKSCHDFDIIRWLIDDQCKSISAFGGLSWFHEGNAPEGSTARCTDGCIVEAICPYSALRIYYRNWRFNRGFDLPRDSSKQAGAVLENLRTSDYGRCVYRMENDQPDHYVCAMQFINNVTATFNMEAFTSYEGRRTRIMGSMGDLVGDMETFTMTDFRTGEKYLFEIDIESGSDISNSGHGGGDWGLMYDFVRAVYEQDESILTSTIEASVESHLMAFSAEKSRKNGKTELVMNT